MAANPVGRPSKYEPAMCETVIECGRQGMTKAEIAAELDIARSTLDDWMATRPEFSNAVKRALDLAQAWWEAKGREATFGAVDGYNATSYIFQMKNRFRDDWFDKTQTDTTFKGTVETKEIGAANAKLLAMLESIEERNKSAVDSGTLGENPGE